MKISEELITPNRALELLVKNTHNRKLRQLHIAKLAKDMVEGRWKQNGDTIRLAKDGTILDGQHRLNAIVESEVAVPSIIVNGLDADAQDTIDCGAPRTAADVLSLNGIKNSAAIAAAIRLIVLYKENTANLSIMPRWRGVSNTRVLEWYNKHTDIQKLFPLAFAARNVAPQSIVLALAYEFGALHGGTEASFFEKLASGEMLRDGDPVLTLRNKLIQIRSGDSYLRSQDYGSYIAYAFDKYMQGLTMHRFYIHNSNFNALATVKQYSECPVVVWDE
jgi:hypothetical protein